MVQAVDVGLVWQEVGLSVTRGKAGTTTTRGRHAYIRSKHVLLIDTETR